MNAWRKHPCSFSGVKVVCDGFAVVKSRGQSVSRYEGCASRYFKLDF